MCVKDEDLAIPLVLGLPGLKGTAPNATDPFSLSVWNQQKGTSSSWGWGSPCPGNVSSVQPTLHRGPLFVVAEGIAGWFRTNWVDCWPSTFSPQQPSMASSFLSSPAERKDSKSHKVFLSQVLQILGEYFITAPDARDLHVQFLLPPPVSWLFTHLLRGLWAHQCHRASWLKALLRSQTGFSGGLAGKESTGSAGDPSSIPGLGRSPGEGIGYPFQYSWASLVAQTIKNPPECRRPWFWSLGWEDPLEKGTATHSSIPAWRIPWTEEPGRLKSMGLQRVGHNWLTFTFTKESVRHRFECQFGSYHRENLFISKKLHFSIFKMGVSENSYLRVFSNFK